MKKKQWFGWFSPLMASRCGNAIYRTEEGKIVKVTTVTNDPKYAGSHWGDEVLVGPVAEFVRSHYRGFFQGEVETTRRPRKMGRRQSRRSA